MLSALLTIVHLALSVTSATLVVRDSPISLPLARRFNVTGSRNIAAADRARVNFLKDYAGASRQGGPSTSSLPVTNEIVSYIAQVLSFSVNLSGRVCELNFALCSRLASAARLQLVSKEVCAEHSFKPDIFL